MSVQDRTTDSWLRQRRSELEREIKEYRAIGRELGSALKIAEGAEATRLKAGLKQSSRDIAEARKQIKTINKMIGTGGV